MTLTRVCDIVIHFADMLVALSDRHTLIIEINMMAVKYEEALLCIRKACSIKQNQDFCAEKILWRIAPLFPLYRRLYSSALWITNRCFGGIFGIALLDKETVVLYSLRLKFGLWKLW